MKHIFYILIIIVTLSSCGSANTISHRSPNPVRVNQAPQPKKNNTVGILVLLVFGVIVFDNMKGE